MSFLGDEVADVLVAVLDTEDGLGGIKRVGEVRFVCYQTLILYFSMICM